MNLSFFQLTFSIAYVHPYNTLHQSCVRYDKYPVKKVPKPIAIASLVLLSLIFGIASETTADALMDGAELVAPSDADATGESDGDASAFAALGLIDVVRSRSEQLTKRIITGKKSMYNQQVCSSRMSTMQCCYSRRMHMHTYSDNCL